VSRDDGIGLGRGNEKSLRGWRRCLIDLTKFLRSDVRRNIRPHHRINGSDAFGVLELRFSKGRNGRADEQITGSQPGLEIARCFWLSTKEIAWAAARPELMVGSLPQYWAGGG
jgi:hypothetical protein